MFNKRVGAQSLGRTVIGEGGEEIAVIVVDGDCKRDHVAEQFLIIDGVSALLNFLNFGGQSLAVGDGVWRAGLVMD